MINKEEFYINFKEQFVEPENIEINNETNYREIDDWDSLTGMAIQIMIKDEYDYDLSVEAFKNCNTVGDIITLIEKNQG